MLSAPPLLPTLMPVQSAPPTIWALVMATLIKAVGKGAAVKGGTSIWEADEGDGHAVEQKCGHGRGQGGAVAAKPADQDRVCYQPLPTVC